MIKPLSNIILKALPSNKKGIIGAQVEVDGVCYHDKLDVCDLKAAYLYNNRYLLLFVIDVDMDFMTKSYTYICLILRLKKLLIMLLLVGKMMA